jgi:hypothetical protein
MINTYSYRYGVYESALVNARCILIVDVHSFMLVDFIILDRLVIYCSDSDSCIGSMTYEGSYHMHVKLNG